MINIGDMNRRKVTMKGIEDMSHPRKKGEDIEKTGIITAIASIRERTIGVIVLLAVIIRTMTTTIPVGLAFPTGVNAGTITFNFLS